MFNKSISRRTFLEKSAKVSLFTLIPRHVLGRGYTAPSDQVTLGFIGAGRQSMVLRNQFLKIHTTKIIGVCDVDADKRAGFINGLKRVHVKKSDRSQKRECTEYEDYRELLHRNDIDAVVIATPDHWHGVISVKAAQAHKDIYCEKPLSLTVGEGRAVVKSVHENNCVFQTGSMQRSWSEFKQAVSLVRDGYIGEVKVINVNVGGPPHDFDLLGEPVPKGLNWDAWLGPNIISRPYNLKLAPPINANFWAQWRNISEFGGGGMTDWGAHMFDIAQWGLDMDDSGPQEINYDKVKGITYKYALGVTMMHKPSSEKPFCHFIGSEGQVKVERGKISTIPINLKNKQFNKEDVLANKDTNHYQDFVQAIRTRQRASCDAETGHRTATVCNLGNIAYQLRRSLTWDPDKELFIKDDEANALLNRPMRQSWVK